MLVGGAEMAAEEAEAVAITEFLETSYCWRSTVSLDLDYPSFKRLTIDTDSPTSGEGDKAKSL
jgi:hypothetical protein